MSLDVLDDVLDLRAEWLAWRRQGIGASDVGAILGLSPWASPYSVWAQKTGRTGETEETEAMEMGLALEPAVADMFHRRTGLWVVGAQTWCEHPDEPWARATLDGAAAESKYSMVADALGGYEAKVTSGSPKKWDEEIPPMYQAQVQFQMWVTGMERTWLGVLHANFGARFRTYGPIDRDEDDIALIAERCRTFWFDHVVAGVPPETDGHEATTQSLKELAAVPGERVDLEPSLAGRLEQLRILQKHEKELKADIEAEKNAIRAAMDTATEAFVDGEPVATWRAHQQTRPDLDALRARFPRAMKKYSNTTPVRTLRLAKIKES